MTAQQKALEALDVALERAIELFAEHGDAFCDLGSMEILKDHRAALTQQDVERGVNLEWSLSEGQYDGVRELIRQAYNQGCKDVHENYQEDSDPDFAEASYDYTASVTDAFLKLFHSGALSPTPPVKDGWQTDSERLNWLELQHVEVRGVLPYGSELLFRADPPCGSDWEVDENKPSDLRDKIDAMLTAAPKQG